MSDPARFIRQMYVSALQGTCMVYDTVAPIGAALPYAVIRVSYNQVPVKESRMFRCSATLQLYAEFKEYGSQEQLDEITDSILTSMAKKGNDAYLTLTGFDHISAKPISVSNDYSENDAKVIMTKTVIMEHLLDTQ